MRGSKSQFLSNQVGLSEYRRKLPLQQNEEHHYRYVILLIKFGKKIAMLKL